MTAGGCAGLHRGVVVASHGGFHDRLQQVPLVAPVVVQGLHRDAGPFGDADHGGRRVTPLGELGPGGGEQRLASRPSQPDRRERRRLQPARHRHLSLHIRQIIHGAGDPGHHRCCSQPVDRVLTEPQQLSATGIQPRHGTRLNQRPRRTLFREGVSFFRLPGRFGAARHSHDATGPGASRQQPASYATHLARHSTSDPGDMLLTRTRTVVAPADAAGRPANRHSRSAPRRPGPGPTPAAPTRTARSRSGRSPRPPRRARHRALRWGRPPGTGAPCRAAVTDQRASFESRQCWTAHLPRLLLSSSRSPRLGRPTGVALRWLRQPRPGAHSHGSGA